MWTWDKILKCEEIKRGVRVESKFYEVFDGIVLGKRNDTRLEVIRDENNIEVFISSTDFSDFKFYNLAGEEILPPHDRETITLYVSIDVYCKPVYCDENGHRYNLNNRRKVQCERTDREKIKANMNKNKSVVVLYADTFEVKEWRN